MIVYRLVNNGKSATPLKTAADQDKKSKAIPAGKKPVMATEITTYTPQLLADDAVLKTDEVYLDEIVLEHTTGSPLLYGIVEVPLPPGASADRTTWGINIKFANDKTAEALEHARYEQTPRGYAVPIDSLSGTVTIRHLVRAAQTGRFMLPPARYYRMYQPEQKAFEEKARASIQIR